MSRSMMNNSPCVIPFSLDLYPSSSTVFVPLQNVQLMKKVIFNKTSQKHEIIVSFSLMGKDRNAEKKNVERIAQTPREMERKAFTQILILAMLAFSLLRGLTAIGEVCREQTRTEEDLTRNCPSGNAVFRRVKF